MPPTKTSSEMQSITIVVPLGTAPEHTYTQQHVNVILTQPQAALLKRILAGLVGKSTTLNQGRYAASAPDVVRWFVEEVERKSKEEGGR